MFRDKLLKAIMSSSALVSMHSGICQGMSWQHLHQPVWLERCYTLPLSLPTGCTESRVRTVNIVGLSAVSVSVASAIDEAKEEAEEAVPCVPFIVRLRLGDEVRLSKMTCDR